MAPTETTRREDKMTANSTAARARLGDSLGAARTALVELEEADRFDAGAERLAGERLMASARKLDHAGRRAL